MIFETEVLDLHTAQSVGRLDCLLSFSNSDETGLLQDLLTDMQSEDFLLKAQNTITLKKKKKLSFWGEEFEKLLLRIGSNYSFHSRSLLQQTLIVAKVGPLTCFSYYFSWNLDRNCCTRCYRIVTKRTDTTVFATLVKLQWILLTHMLKRFCFTKRSHSLAREEMSVVVGADKIQNLLYSWLSLLIW